MNATKGKIGEDEAIHHKLLCIPMIFKYNFEFCSVDNFTFTPLHLVQVILDANYNLGMPFLATFGGDLPTQAEVKEGMHGINFFFQTITFNSVLYVPGGSTMGIV